MPWIQVGEGGQILGRFCVAQPDLEGMRWAEDADLVGKKHPRWDDASNKLVDDNALWRAEAESMVLHRINAEFARRMAPITSAYPDETQKTFAKQEEEARRLQSGSNDPTPFLDQLSAATGKTRAEKASSIIAKADAFALFVGALEGRRQALEDSLSSVSNTNLESMAMWHKSEDKPNDPIVAFWDGV